MKIEMKIAIVLLLIINAVCIGVNVDNFVETSRPVYLFIAALNIAMIGFLVSTFIRKSRRR